MSDSIGPQPWMTAPATRAVVGALQAAGGEGCVRFVGGCVRNAVMKMPIDDIDLATTLTPDAVVAALAAAGLRSAPTGVEHGTITAIALGATFEVTTLRRDVSTDGRRAVVVFTEDWAQDAQRRDFRLNALYADMDGGLMDPTGLGLQDALAGRIVFVGDPLQRIREDYLRILRFFRFLAWYGRGAPDAAALAACKALRGLLAGRAAERTSKELLKLLGARDPRQAIDLMAQAGALEALLPGAVAVERLAALVGIETDHLAENDPELRLAALLPSDAKAAAAAAEALRLSNAQQGRLVAAAGAEPPIVPSMSEREVRRAVYRLGQQTFRDRVKLAWAGSVRSATAGQWRSLLTQAEGWAVPAFPITGKDAMAAGAPKGPRVGQVLREVEAWWIDQDFPTDRDPALQRLKRAVDALA